ncbi:hypothetical protein COO60DRAFT_990913 [Scenedesmus sp. NREL 46B-D3]|nr:hypothetical protein COO60DRAFT_990913 [Scenedesmus sp. NREL 46B-D3]
MGQFSHVSAALAALCLVTCAFMQPFTHVCATPFKDCVLHAWCKHGSIVQYVIECSRLACVWSVSHVYTMSDLLLFVMSYITYTSLDIVQICQTAQLCVRVWKSMDFMTSGTLVRCTCSSHLADQDRNPNRDPTLAHETVVQRSCFRKP